MTVDDLERFRNLLAERQRTVSEWLVNPDAAQPRDVEKAENLLGEILEAIERVDEHSFGTCVICKGEVEMERLEIQPVLEVCLSCITDEEKQELEYELSLASRMHRALLPQTARKIDGFDLAVQSLASRAVGGDYYDFLLDGPGGSPRVVVADAMGKGVPAGLLMSNVQGALRVLAEEIESPCRLVSRLNRWLCRNVSVTKFISLACVSLQPVDDSVTRIVYANAGHCPPLLVRANGSIETLDPTGAVLGVHPEFVYTECLEELRPGDLLALYTDGVTEAENAAEDQFGVARLCELLAAGRQSAPDVLLRELYQSVKDFTGREDMADDYTVIVLKKR